LYTKDYLEKTNAGPAAPSAPSVVAASASAPVDPASVMEIVAKLQEDVDAIKAKLGM
jgi:hypothetical protein